MGKASFINIRPQKPKEDDDEQNLLTFNDQKDL